MKERVVSGRVEGARAFRLVVLSVGCLGPCSSLVVKGEKAYGEGKVVMLIGLFLALAMCCDESRG